MASVHKQSSQSSSSSSSCRRGGNSCGAKSGNNTGGSSWGRRLADEIWDDFDLPISRKGRFFQDSSFEHARDGFDTTIQDLLKKWGDDKDSFFDDRRGGDKERRTPRHSDSFNRYRNLRSRNLKDDNQAVTVTSDNNTHKIVLDVEGLQESEVKVKLVGERELVVEGRGGGAAGESQGFKRSFSLPQDVIIDAITSVMSSDGILTITAPKTVSQTKSDGSSVSDTGKSNTSETSNLNTASKTTSARATTSETRNTTSADKDQEDDCDCDVCVAKYGKKSTQQQQQQQSTKAENQNDSQTKKTQSSSSFTAETKSETKQGANNGNHVDAATPGSKEKVNRESVQKEHVSNVSSSKSDFSDAQQTGAGKQANTEAKTQPQKSSTSEFRDFHDIPFSFRESLPIKRRGHFFDDDSFIEDTRKGFHSTVNDILRKWGETDLLEDDTRDTNLRRSDSFSRYRKLREHNLKDDNQAIIVTSDNSTHKIVLDVQEFMEGDVKVKLVGERELVVEGQRLPGAAPQSFKRSFPLPEEVKLEEITSVLSSDGILTITAPKIVRQSKDSDKTIPIRVSQAETCSSSSTTTQTTSKMSDKSVNEGKQNSQSSSHEQKEKLMTDNTRNASNQSVGSQQSSEHTVYTQGTSSAKLQSRDEGKSEENHSVTESNLSTSIPIKKREGLFFRDSYFETAWKDYQDAMSDVVSQWGGDHTASHSDDTTISYRKLRNADMREENQAVSTTEDNQSYKFIVDIEDFLAGGDINVKVVEEREVVVQGRVNVKDQSGSSSTKRFLRLFVLPDDVRQEDISSVVSSDGVLTITVPKKYSNVSVKDKESCEQERQRETKHSTSTQVEEHVIPVKLIVTQDGQIVNVTAGEAGMTTSSSQTEDHKEKSVSREREVNINVEDTQKDAAMKKDVTFTDGEVDEETDAVHRRLEADDKETDLQTENETAESSKQRYIRRDFDEIYKNRLLPIKTRGNFFEDFFFEDSRQSFGTAVKEVLEKSGEKQSSSDNAYTSYRNLRQRNLKLENQAGRIDEDDRFQWIVLDVFDFLDGEVTAEVVDGKEVIVRGRARRHEGSSVVIISFMRPFQLSPDVNLEAITAVMSSDGVLIIIAPKLPLCSEFAGTYEDNIAERERPSSTEAVDIAGRRLKERNLRESSTDSEGRCFRFSSPHRLDSPHRFASPNRRHNKEASTERQSVEISEMGRGWGVQCPASRGSSQSRSASNFDA